MLQHILPIIPLHKHYCEPFAGGAAVFFNKQPSTLETINDTNEDLINFYRVVKTDFEALNKEIQATLHSRREHAKAKEVLVEEVQQSELRRAWAFRVAITQSRESILGASWSSRITSSKVDTVFDRKMFSNYLCRRLDNAYIECGDALALIGRIDYEETFFYIDPPYYNANMGHYKGYTEDDFGKLLALLAAIKGKFLLSCYPSDLLETFVKQNEWDRQVFVKRKSAGTKEKNMERTKVECLVSNYNQDFGVQRVLLGGC